MKFLEYQASADAQAHFAHGNNEWPVVAGVKLRNPVLEAFGSFKTETMPVSVIGQNQLPVQQMPDRVGYR